MTDREMIEALRDYARTYTSGKPYGFNPGLALMIANRMEQLIALVENGQSAIDTNQRLVKELEKMEAVKYDRKDK